MGGREYALFAVGIGVTLLHVLDDAFVGKQPGTTAADHLLPAAIILVVLVGALVLYPRLRAGLRAALAVGLGLLIATAGAMHVAHAIIDEAERSDFTGWLATAGGALLIGWASSLPGERPRTRTAVGGGSGAAWSRSAPSSSASTSCYRSGQRSSSRRRR